VLLRTRGLAVGLAVFSGFLGGLFLLASTPPRETAGERAGTLVVGLVAAAVSWRSARAGLRLEPDAVTVRGLTWSERLPRADVVGLAVTPALRGRAKVLSVVARDGRVIAAGWTIAGSANQEWDGRAAYAASGSGPTQPLVGPALDAVGRAAAGTGISDRPGETPDGRRLPATSPEPLLDAVTVGPLEPGPQSRWLGWETGFVIVAFAFPGLADAIVILVQHVGGVSDLNEFELPLPHNAPVSLLLLLLRYSTTALIVPIALLLLTRTGQPPAALGLQRRDWRRDLVGGAALLAGAWLLEIVLLSPLRGVLGDKSLTNTATNSHVPAYFVVYALVLAATTAVNEEVLVNGYFLTRLAQRGWGPWQSLALSLAVRTSYHVYYGIGLIGTIPFGYLATRSFQKHRRLGRPIVAHFLNDAILLTVAVLTS
jgi:hypothetical protein